MTGNIPRITTISNTEFLTAIFGQCAGAAHVTGFSEAPDQLPHLGLQSYWGGDAWYRNNLEDVDSNNFFVISTFNLDSDGTHRRRKNNFAAGFCMMIDDVGVGPGAHIDPIDMLSYPLPSWRLETSPSNFQYGYIFETPTQARGEVESLLKGFVALGLVDSGSDPGMLGCTRYARLPVGSNTKSKLAERFPHVLHEWRPERRYKLSNLATGFGITLSKISQQEDSYGTPQAIESDPIYQSLKRLDLIKSRLRENVWDITCPWQAQHTEELDNGTAYLAPMGFKCHHGHCESRTSRDLLNWLHGQDPEYAAACAVQIPFEPVDDYGQAERAKGFYQSQITDEVAPEQPFKEEINHAIHEIMKGEVGSSASSFRLLSISYFDLTKEEREHYLLRIKDATGYTLKLSRDMLSEARKNLLKEYRDNGTLKEPAWKEIREDKVVGCLENFRAICEFHGITMRYNQMSHTIECNVPKDEFADEDIDNLNLSYMRDLMQKYGVGFTRAGEWMNSYAHENGFHPFLDYLNEIENRTFDPTCPMFAKLMSTLKVVEFPDQAEVFVRRWFISVVAAVRGHGGAGMKGVLTFSGPQGIGKTSWFREIFPTEMFCEGLVLDPHNKDTKILATSHLVCELGELDATFRRDIPALKAFISNQSDKIRHPYAAKESAHPRRTVFCATVNQSDFLVDQTGNSRFWPVAVSDCDYTVIAEMKKSGEIDLLWREFDAMYQACSAGRTEFKWWLGPEDMGMLSEVSEAYIRETTGEAMLKDHYEMNAPAVHWVTTADLMSGLGFSIKDPGYAARKQEVIAAIKRITQQRSVGIFRQDGEVVRGWRLPQRKLRKMAANLSVVPVVPDIEEFDFL